MFFQGTIQHRWRYDTQLIAFLLWMLSITVVTACQDFPTAEKTRQMRAVLEEAEAQNLAYIPFTTDTLLRRAADYFDRHGTANERLKAHYLLGCVYRDLNEAPHALQCYQDAIEVADTLSPDCDYQTLLAVYGQLGELYYYQNLPYEQLEALRKYHHYALIAKDTFNMLRNYELMVGPYDLLGDTNRILEIEQKARELYEQYGYHQAAASALSATIHININRGRLDEARRQINVFEHESGLFDEKGNICKDREGYYYTKGKYLAQVGQLDSAESYFRRLTSTQWAMNAYRGLLTVYRQRGNTDSIYKFSRLYESAVDTMHYHNRTEVMHRMSSLYNYSRFSQLAEKKEKENLRMRLFLQMLLGSIVILALTGWWRYSIYRAQQREKLKRISESYRSTFSAYKKIQQEVIILKQENSELLKSKEQEMQQLLAEMELQQNTLSGLRKSMRVSTLLSNGVVDSLREKSKGKLHNTLPTDDEWDELTALLAQCQPLLFQKIFHDNDLSLKERQVCMLVYLGFATGEIAVLMDTTIQHITNIKTRANKKLFNAESATTLLRNLKLTEQ